MSSNNTSTPTIDAASTKQLSLSEIRAPIEEELQQFEQHFRASLKTEVGLLNRVLRYMLKRKGKQMRPMFVLFTARLCGGITPQTYRAAALIELLHTATLIHDDVVDDADERRGMFSINALWKNKISVLMGDFLLSRGLLMSIEHNDFELLRITTDAVRLMSEGELLQIEKARRLNIDEPVYYEIIRMKTASLLATCAACGAESAGADQETRDKLRQFGEDVGMAFQIKDDLFDYGANKAGKPQAIDIQEKKITLPLIYVLNRSSWTERRKLIRIIKNHNTDKQKVDWLMRHVEKHGGITYARERMHHYADKALTTLHDFEPSPARDSLEQLVRYTILRNK